MPRVSNGMSVDPHLLRAWGGVVEFERGFRLGEHRGVARVLLFANHAHMGSYKAAVNADLRPADLSSSRAYREKHGLGLGLEQEISDEVAVFARAGWNDGRSESWCFSDADRSGSAGFSVKGGIWGRGGDVLGLAGACSDISRAHQKFLGAGGSGILAGDGALNYRAELIAEAFYSLKVSKTFSTTFDYQFVTNPAFNRARGPVSVFGVRYHWEY